MAEVDLTNPGRRTTQRRITNNRDGVLPTRRNTDTPAVAIRADMRAASRGDGGADELRRILDGFTDSVQSFGNARTMASQDRFRQEAADGSLDAQTGGEIDPARASSLAYQEAFYRTKAEASFNAFAVETKAAVDDALAQGQGPAEVEALVMERVTSFRDQVLETIPNPSAQRDTAMRLSAMGGELEAGIATTIRERTQAEFIQTEQGNIGARIRGGEALNFEGYVTTFRAGGLDLVEAKRAALEAVVAVALDRDDPNPELLNTLLDSTKADGGPSLSAAEQLAVQDRVTQARSLADQIEREAREDRRDTLLTEWFPKAIDGEIIDDQIVEAGRRGDLEPQEVAQYLGLFNNLREAREEGHADEDFILDVTRRAALNGRPPTNAQVLQWEREGRFGTGRAARRAAIQFLQDGAAARRAAAGGGGVLGLSARTEATRNVSTARQYLWAQTAPEGEQATWSPYQGQMLILQDRELNRRIRAGEDPLVVASDLAERNRDLIRGDRGPRQQQPPRQAPPQYTYDARGNLVRQ